MMTEDDHIIKQGFLREEWTIPDWSNRLISEDKEVLYTKGHYNGRSVWHKLEEFFLIAQEILGGKS